MLDASSRLRDIYLSSFVLGHVKSAVRYRFFVKVIENLSHLLFIFLEIAGSMPAALAKIVKTDLSEAFSAIMS